MEGAAFSLPSTVAILGLLVGESACEQSCGHETSGDLSLLLQQDIWTFEKGECLPARP